MLNFCYVSHMSLNKIIQSTKNQIKINMFQILVHFIFYFLWQFLLETFMHTVGYLSVNIELYVWTHSLILVCMYYLLLYMRYDMWK